MNTQNNNAGMLQEQHCNCGNPTCNCDNCQCGDSCGAGCGCGCECCK